MQIIDLNAVQHASDTSSSRATTEGVMSEPDPYLEGTLSVFLEWCLQGVLFPELCSEMKKLGYSVDFEAHCTKSSAIVELFRQKSLKRYEIVAPSVAISVAPVLATVVAPLAATSLKTILESDSIPAATSRTSSAPIVRICSIELLSGCTMS